MDEKQPDIVNDIPAPEQTPAAPEPDLSAEVVAQCGGKLGCCDWLADIPESHDDTEMVEVQFKNTRKGYYKNSTHLRLEKGDIVAVEGNPGHDIGVVSLTGRLVLLQMKKNGVRLDNPDLKRVYRKAKPNDLEKYREAKSREHSTMLRARKIAEDLHLNMKIGDVEYQGDKIKAIFYYIADERVDFRELIKVFAEQFHIRIEMKQIGARQEAGRIGGLGACGRELCCASWISNFTSVTTNSARMQEISLNPQKLAGQCSKLKCCMAYEYDVYADARREFPRLREPLQTVDGEWFLVKSDILAGTMQFSSSKDTMSNVTTLSVARVKEIMAANRAGHRVDSLQGEVPSEVSEEPTYRSGSDEDSITRFDRERGKRRRKHGNRRNGSGGGHRAKNGNGGGNAGNGGNNGGKSADGGGNSSANNNANNNGRRNNGNNNNNRQQ